MSQLNAEYIQRRMQQICIMDCPGGRDLPLQAHGGLAFTFNAEVLPQCPLCQRNQCTRTSTQCTVITKYVSYRFVKRFQLE